MRVSTVALIVAIGAAFPAAVLAQGAAPSTTTPSPSKEADKMRTGDTTGSTPNAAIPGANPAADGNATQDSRTTKDKNR